MSLLHGLRKSVLALSCILALVASEGAVAQTADKPLKVGVSAGPYGDILREAAKVAAKDGLKAEIIEFTDWNQPNAALQAGDIDLNNFQHRFYLANQIKARGYQLVALDESILVPAGLYSKSYARSPTFPMARRSPFPTTRRTRRGPCCCSRRRDC